MNRQQTSSLAGNKATHVQRVHYLIFFRLNDSHLIFAIKIETGQSKLLSSRYICLYSMVMSYIDLFYWSSPIIHTNTNQTQFGKMKSTINIVGWIWFKANLFIYWRDRIHIHANWIGKKPNLVKKNSRIWT